MSGVFQQEGEVHFKYLDDELIQPYTPNMEFWTLHELYLHSLKGAGLFNMAYNTLQNALEMSFK